MRASSFAILCGIGVPASGRTDPPPRIEVVRQPLAANVRRVLDALEFLGRPLDADLTKRLSAADG